MEYFKVTLDRFLIEKILNSLCFQATLFEIIINLDAKESVNNTVNVKSGKHARRND